MANRDEIDREKTLDPENPEEGIITRSPDMLALKAEVKHISRYAKVFLIAGETGTGKELIAELFHYHCKKNKRRRGRLVSFNAAGTDDQFFSDTVFGHKKGAFTGAETDRDGLIRRAEKGVLFLDEIGDLSLVSQTKLLRLIEKGEYFPLGSDAPVEADVFIVLATHKPLIDLVRRGAFRKDLYYRICANEIGIPPLRVRKADIPLLAGYFAERFAKEWKTPIAALDENALDLLRGYDFPGNVRELKGMLECALSRTGSASRKKALAAWIELNGVLAVPAEDGYTEIRAVLRKLPEPFPLREFKEKLTELLTAEALYRAGGSQTAAAGLIGVSQAAISKGCKKASIGHGPLP
jgi:transcriptional regulator with GAF, ATPase, and Fis domain